MINIKRFENGLQIVPNASGNTAPDIQGELAVWQGSQASFSGIITGTSTSVTLVAQANGTAGNSINLTFNGSTSINSEISAWNTANPTNQVSLQSGDGTQVPSNLANAQLANGGPGDGNLYYSNGIQTYPISAAITALTGDVTTTQGPGSVVATVDFVGGATAAAVAAAAAASGSATSSDTPNTLVKRDGSGNFAAGTITAALIGNVTGNLTGNVTGNVSGTSSNVTGIVLPINGGTGIANNNNATLAFNNPFSLTLNLSAPTTLTLPVTGTLATLSNPETFSNKTFATAQTWQKISTPANPPAGSIDIYAKSDNNIYTLTSGGLESSITQGAAPSGAISMFGGTIAPSGWLLCDGSAVSKITYQSLYNVIGSAFGVGNAATQTTANLTTVADVSTAAFASPGGGVVITAVNLGFIGNSISLVFNGINDVAVVTTNWNIANPSNQVTYTGSGSFVPTSQTLNFTNGNSTTDGTYFEIYDDTDLVIPWIKIASTTTQPTVPSFAFFTGVITGTFTSVTLTAVTSGAAGDSISLSFSGSNSINSAITTWNTANPSNTVTLTSGDGTQVPTVGASAPLNWGATRYIQINGVTSDDTATAIATAIASALAADSSFTPTTSLSNVVTITNTSTISHPPGNAGDSPFAYTQTNTGGFSTFNLPDFRGMFPRGVAGAATGNDPDFASRGATNGGNSGNAVGSTQGWQVQSHAHNYFTYTNTNGGGGVPTSQVTTPAFTGSTQAFGGNQTNPINLYVNFIIKT